MDQSCLSSDKLQFLPKDVPISDISYIMGSAFHLNWYLEWWIKWTMEYLYLGELVKQAWDTLQVPGSLK